MYELREILLFSKINYSVGINFMSTAKENLAISIQAAKVKIIILNSWFEKGKDLIYSHSIQRPII